MATARKTRAERIMDRCKHFTGVQHETCGVGVPYASVRPKEGGGLPCLREPMCNAECPRVEYPTREEAEKEAADEEAIWARHSLAHRAAHDDAKVKKFGKGQGGADSCPCPVCEKGRIYSRVAAYNGHMHARCETDGCVSWME
jgi:hypothetical protein